MNSKDIKLESERLMCSLGLSPNLNLPAIEEIQDLNFKTSEQIAKRILVLAYLYGIAFGVSRKSIQSKLKQYNLLNDLSGLEQNLLTKQSLTTQDKININWITESIEVLGWTIGLWNEIPLLKICDEDRQADNIPLNESPIDFIGKVQLLSKYKIHQQADLIYRMHWITKRNEIGELKVHSNDVYMERHKAINWVIGLDSDWDMVRTDT